MALFLVIVSIALLAVAAASIYSIVLMKDAKHVLNQLESSVRDISEKSGPLLENSVCHHRKDQRDCRKC